MKVEEKKEYSEGVRAKGDSFEARVGCRRGNNNKKTGKELNDSRKNAIFAVEISVINYTTMDKNQLKSKVKELLTDESGKLKIGESELNVINSVIDEGEKVVASLSADKKKSLTESVGKIYDTLKASPLKALKYADVLKELKTLTGKL